jgi:ElaB/YqjD/DUF883 family membrane-anchored ribosome-binding protein
MRTNIQASKDRLILDLKNVVSDSEQLLKEVTGQLTEKGKVARARLSASLESAKATYADLQEKAVAGLETTDKLVHEHPYRSVGLAFGLGVLIGVLVTRD